MSRLVRVQFPDPVHRDGAMPGGVRWETIGVTGGLSPVLDANVRLSEESGQRGRVALTASCRPPFGLLGAELPPWPRIGVRAAGPTSPPGHPTAGTR